MSVRGLAFLLGIQALLVTVTWWPSGGPGEAVPLVALEAEDVTAIRIERKGGDSPLALERSGEGWAIASAGGYPARESAVDELLAKLLDARVRTPVATRATSHDSLQVGEDEWGRKITLEAGDQAETLVVGPAARSGVYLRRADSDEVYLVTGFSEWSLSERPNSYYDPQYVQVDPANVVAFSLENDQGELALTRVDGSWQLADAAEGEVLDQAAVDALVADAARVRISKPVGREIEEAFGLDEGVRVAWSLAAEDATVAGGYRVGAKVDGLAYVKADDRPFVVQTSESSVESLRSTSRDDLLE